MSLSVPEVSPSPSPSPICQAVSEPTSGWTQISRKSRKRRKTNVGDNFDGDGDVGDNGTTAAAAAIQTQEHEKSDLDPDSNPDKCIMTTLSGKALFCLHSLDTKWFQGQFLMTPSLSLSPSLPTDAQPGRVKTLGLMVKERSDMDECLRCDDNGYREIDLTVLLSSSTTSASDSRPAGESNLDVNKEQRQKHTLQRLTCTGGDMLRIRSPLDGDDEIDSKPVSNCSGVSKENVAFDADQIITGVKVERLVRQFFPNLIPASMKISDTSEEDDKHVNQRRSSLLDELPDCAVVIGDMKLTLPSKLLQNNIQRPTTCDESQELW